MFLVSDIDQYELMSFRSLFGLSMGFTVAFFHVLGSLHVYHILFDNLIMVLTTFMNNSL